VQAGVSYHSSAGNEAEQHLEQDFAGTDVNDFGGGDNTDAVVVPPGGTLTCILEWNDPFGASGNDYDLFLFDQNLSLLDGYPIYNPFHLGGLFSTFLDSRKHAAVTGAPARIGKKAGAAFKASLSQPGPWTLWMEGYGETLPRHENRVSLSRETRDQWGLPTLDIDMTYGPNETAMRLDMAEQAAAITRAGGFENVSTFNETPIPGAVIHEMGTARMGADPKTSVLTQFLQTHDIANLYVMDASSFVSSACQNPTLTIMALAVRGCDRLMEEMKRGNV
jgi:choline dehydrogenase-like flavoprotein